MGKKDKKRKRKERESSDDTVTTVSNAPESHINSQTQFSRTYVVNDHVRLIAHGNQRGLFAGVTVETVDGGPINVHDLNACIETLEIATVWLDRQIAEAGFTPTHQTGSFASVDAANKTLMMDMDFAEGGRQPDRLAMVDDTNDSPAELEPASETKDPTLGELMRSAYEKSRADASMDKAAPDGGVHPHGKEPVS